MKSTVLNKIIIPISNLKKRSVQKFQIAKYRIRGKRPWSTGYNEYKWQSIEETLNNTQTMTIFKDHTPLDKNYGVGIDERIVEYPWLISNISKEPGRLLDAGSALNFSNLLDQEVFVNKKIMIANLNPESNCYWEKEISYLYEDLRTLPLEGGLFDVITCISTLEHVGMDNTAMYTKNLKYSENERQDYLKVILELKRLLKSGGELFITIPFGEYQDFGFFQQFNSGMVQRILDTFGDKEHSVEYFRYTNQGWQTSNEKESSREKYFNIHSTKIAPPDLAAAARSVACIKLSKNT